MNKAQTILEYTMCESGYALLFMSGKWSYFHPPSSLNACMLKTPIVSLTKLSWLVFLWEVKQG